VATYDVFQFSVHGQPVLGVRHDRHQWEEDNHAVQYDDDVFHEELCRSPSLRTKPATVAHLMKRSSIGKQRSNKIKEARLLTLQESKRAHLSAMVSAQVFFACITNNWQFQQLVHPLQGTYRTA